MIDIVWAQNVLFPLLGMGLGGLAMFWLYRTVNRWIDRKHEHETALRGATAGGPELEHLRARVEALEGTADRLLELEERVDFTERVLARERGRPALSDGDEGGSD